MNLPMSAAVSRSGMRVSLARILAIRKTTGLSVGQGWEWPRRTAASSRRGTARTGSGNPRVRETRLEAKRSARQSIVSRERGGSPGSGRVP